MTRLVRTGALLAMLWCLPAAAPAQDLGELAGTVDVSNVEAKINGERQETLRQLYTVNYLRPFTSYVDFRAGLRFYDLDIELADAQGNFRREVQPSGELSWRHPWFTFTAAGIRQTAQSPAISGHLITDSYLFDWNSAWREAPSLNFRYRRRSVKETGDLGMRDTRSETLEGGITWSLERESFEYRITRDEGENLVRGLENVSYQQRFHYSGAHELAGDGDLRMTSQYRYTRSDLTTEVGTGERFLERVELVQGLGGIDATPDRDPLPIVPALIDGNTRTPVVPPLAVGSGQADRNVGADLGVRRSRLGAVYVYVDRLSAAGMVWDLWTSDDNLNWSRPVSAVSTFNASLSRYEISFALVEAQFIKVVNGGLNTVPDVQVTEIEVYEAREETGTVEENRSSHFADARFDWFISPRWSASLDLAARLQPPSGSVPQRLQYDYVARTTFDQSLASSHVVSLSQSWQELEGESGDTRADKANYSYFYDPLPTLGTSLSGAFTQTIESFGTSIRAVSASAAVNATPWPAIVASADLGASRIDQPVIDLNTDSWTARAAVDADVTRNLSVSVTGRHQQTYSGPDRDLRVLRGLTLSGELRLTGSILGRASLILSDDADFFRNERYLASWRLFSRLLVSGQYDSDSSSAGFRSDRWTASASMDLFERFLVLRNVTAYTQFSELKQNQGADSHILSWSYGMRAVF